MALQEQKLMETPKQFPLPSHIQLQLKMEEQAKSGKPNENSAGGKKIKFVNPNIDNYPENIKHATKLHKEGMACLSRGMLKGKNVIVAGSGPSLKTAEVLDQIRKQKENGDLVVACKHAIRFLTDEGIEVDYSVTMDPGAHIARPDIKIYKAPGCKHIVASSSDPILFKYLMSDLPYNEWLLSLTEDDQKRVLAADFEDWKKGDFKFDDLPEALPAEVMIFHSATGLQDEFNIYKNNFDHGDCMGGGYNVVNRAVAAMLYASVGKITCAGTDCGWREDQNFYVGGAKSVSGVDMCDNGMIDGKPWHTRPDMLASGIALAKLSQNMPKMFTFLGDTLPAKLALKDDAFLKRCGDFVQQ